MFGVSVLDGIAVFGTTPSCTILRHLSSKSADIAAAVEAVLVAAGRAIGVAAGAGVFVGVAVALAAGSAPCVSFAGVDVG